MTSNEEAPLLTIHYGDIDGVIYNTSIYFNNTYSKDWLADPFAQRIIKSVDKGIVLGPNTIETKALGIIPPEKLSTGAKALLLMYFTDGHIFDASSCGDNCACWILRIAAKKDLAVNLNYLMDFGNGRFTAKVANTGKIVSNMMDLKLEAAPCLMSDTQFQDLPSEHEPRADEVSTINGERTPHHDHRPQDLTESHPAPPLPEHFQSHINDEILNEATAIVSDLAAWRHFIHQNPETGLNTSGTSRFIQAHLNKLNVNYTTLLRGNAVVASLGATEGNCVLLRADMDALPFKEKSGEPWASTNGNSHSCGHDMHATALLGAAQILKRHEQELIAFGTNVKLLFQPGEETFEGSLACIDAGVLNRPTVRAAFALHVNGRCPMGLMIYGEQAFAGSYTFKKIIHGHGGHGSGPQNCIDPITAAAHVHLGLQEIIAREVGASEEAILTIGKFTAGATPNSIPDDAVLEGTLRAFDPELMNRLVDRIKNIANGIATAYRATAEVETLSLIPPTHLDSQMLENSVAYIGNAIPNMRFRKIQHSTGAEDFALFSERVPSSYITVGAAAKDADEHFTMHDPRVRFDDAILPSLSAAYAAVALGWAVENSKCP